MALNSKKYLVKSASMIIFILAIAFMGTYIVYNEFNNTYNEVIETESLTITYQDKERDLLKLENATPVSDGIGKSSNPIKMSLKNNTEEEIKYTAKILLDAEALLECKCSDLLLNEKEVKVNVFVNNREVITVLLNDLENGILLDEVLLPNEEVDLSFRIWVEQGSNVEQENVYYGQIVIEEKDM